MGKSSLYFWAFLFVVAFSGQLQGASGSFWIENNALSLSLRCRITNFGYDDVVHESVDPDSVIVGWTDENVQSQDLYEIYVFDSSDVFEDNVLFYASVSGNQILLASAAGEVVHVSLSTGMYETSIGRIILQNTTSESASWNGNFISPESTNAFEVPQGTYGLAVWDEVIRPWGSLSSVQILQPVDFSQIGTLTADLQKMLWLHNNGAEQWVIYTWNALGNEWVYAAIGGQGEGSGATGGGGGTGGGGTGGGGGGTGGGSSVTGSVTIGGQNFPIQLQGIALETTQLRNEILLENIRLGSVTNNSELAGVNNLLTSIEAVLTNTNGSPNALNEVTVRNEVFANAAEAEVEQEAGGFLGLFRRAVGFENLTGQVDSAIFDWSWTAGSMSHTINFDPRTKPFVMSMAALMKAIICTFVFYIVIMYCWEFYDKGMKTLAMTPTAGTAGESIVGTNLNIATAAVNAGAIMFCMLLFMSGIIAMMTFELTGSVLAAFMSAPTGILDGTHSSYSSLPAQQMIIFIDTFIPLTCIIGGAFIVGVIKILGHAMWVGCTAIVKFCNA